MLLSPGYYGRVHGVSINFDLAEPSDVMAKIELLGLEGRE
jgi:hypothetical protein